MEKDQSNAIAACRLQREEAAAAPYTIAHAIADAQWLRRTPDGLLTPDKAKQCIDALLAALERSKCYFNATLRGQETFVLVQQDRAAAVAIQAWAQVAMAHGAREKAMQATGVAIRWGQQDPAITKWPD